MEDIYRKNIVDFSLIQLDKNFSWGMKGPDEFDESGFTFYIFFELFGINIEDGGFGSSAIAKQMTNSIGILKQYVENHSKKREYLKGIKPGDLLFFKTDINDNNGSQQLDNVGIYLGDNKFIYASEFHEKVVVSEFDDKWVNKLIASRDIVSNFILKANF